MSRNLSFHLTVQKLSCDQPVIVSRSGLPDGVAVDAADLTQSRCHKTPGNRNKISNLPLIRGKNFRIDELVLHDATALPLAIFSSRQVCGRTANVFALRKYMIWRILRWAHVLPICNVGHGTALAGRYAARTRGLFHSKRLSCWLACPNRPQLAFHLWIKTFDGAIGWNPGSGLPAAQLYSQKCTAIPAFDLVSLLFWNSRFYVPVREQYIVQALVVYDRLQPRQD
jgi:hypothetical protein